MPYVVSVRSDDLVFPPLCPFCCRRPFDATVPEAVNEFARSSVLTSPFVAAGLPVDEGRVALHRASLPACTSCARGMRRWKLLAQWSIALAWAPTFGAFLWEAHPPAPVRKATILFALVAMALWAISLVALWRRRRRMRLAHVKQGQLLFTVSDRAYAEDFATLVGSHARWEWFAFRWS